MILQALKEYYDRKPGELSPIGWIRQKIDYAIILTKEGHLQQLDCLQELKDGKRESFPCHVPNIGKQALKHTNSGIDANLLWDNAAFVLGVGKNGDKKLASFIETIKQWLGEVNDQTISAVLCFLKAGKANPGVFAPITKHPDFGEDIASGRPTMTFRLFGEKDFVFARPLIKQAIADKWSRLAENIGPGICLVTGNPDNIEPCHTVIKGVWGAQMSGATIVGFNYPAFCSFDKDQGANAPVGKIAAFAYTTALNHLLGKDSKQRMQVGDASTVFWAQKATDFESQVVDFFGEPPKDNPDRNARAVESLFRSVQSGTFVADDARNRFYVLGLAPNASRIAIRFWIMDTVAGMASKIRQHFEDTRIVHGPRDKDFFSLFRLLVCTAVQGKADNIPPNLGGDTMRAILEGLPYPQTLLSAAIRRIRAEHEITYLRAALIKACINRATRYQNPSIKEEMHVSIDPNNTNIGYRLGRLFATLERIQIRKHTQKGGKEPNSTIRDRYYGSASGTPVTVFGTLIRLSKHHLASLENVGERINFEKLLGEIMCGISDFPAHLKLEDQGRFAIGYYHQMQDFFTK
ncbi:MAG: type I-C CRISPR-associated protein Cas8c/Csd1 [Verrucomicrobia bacterium]|nr:type I-C CRISPR-associated protein Cas8c/Csd1 [Verrucomicrobiota bacterium]MBU1735007.1 type I-C CRISPR-associated protein Cas8c/Csd1 [Verrucomicrobiota bacterium]MBU1855351.1 type I-C CRISPR-associated protein Cas8c/Csd1 [Verrucomicrobiota bacterium]